MENRNFVIPDDIKRHFMVVDDGKSLFYDGEGWKIVILWWRMMKNRHFMVLDDEKLSF